MMKKHTYLYVALFVATILSCKSENKKDSTLEEAISSTHIAENRKAPVKTDKYTGQLNQLLTKEMAATITGFDVSLAKEKYSQIIKDQAFHEISYSWKNGRKGKIKGLEGEYPLTDIVSLSQFKTTTLEQFKKSYHTPTEDELKKLDEILKKKTDGKENGDLALNIAKGLAEGLSFDEMPGTGEYSVWNNKHKELNTYYRGIQFQIRVSISNDEATNKEKSVAIARMIIEKL